MPLSLMSAARRNRTAVRAAARALIRADGSGTLTRFHALAGGSGFSSNVSADKITVFHKTGSILDARSIAQHRAGGDRRAGLRAFRCDQRTWYTRRVRFEAIWRFGRQFVYGAVNAGGMGTEARFGPFCLVIGDPERSSPAALAIFPSNSAARYCSREGAVDDASARNEVVPWPGRADAATIQRGAEALATPEPHWPVVLCSASAYLEAVIAPSPARDALSAVRVREAYLERLEDLEGRLLAGDTLHGADSHEATAFEALNEWRRTSAIAIESVG